MLRNALSRVRLVWGGRGHFRLALPYAAQKTVARLVEERGGRVTAEEYGAEVTWGLWFPHSAWRGFAAALTESSQGTLAMEPADEA